MFLKAKYEYYELQYMCLVLCPPIVHRQQSLTMHVYMDHAWVTEKKLKCLSSICMKGEVTHSCPSRFYWHVLHL